MHTISEDAADHVWIEARKLLLGVGAHTQASRNGETKEVMRVAMEIRDPRQRWVNSREPALNPAFALAEVLWIVTGSRDLAFLKFWNGRIEEFVGSDPEVRGAYGWRLRHTFGVDQLDAAASALSSNSDSRQVVLQIWDPRSDLPGASGAARSPDIPCNVMALLKIRDNKLEWTQISRSNDLFLGLPYNFIQFTTLQEILAGWIGVDIGTYTHWSDSLHLYSTDIAIEASDTSIPAANTDDIALPREQSDSQILEVMRRARGMADELLTRPILDELTLAPDIAVGLQNWLAILGAEVARRQRWGELSTALANRCSNPALALASARWSQRWQAR